MAETAAITFLFENLTHLLQHGLRLLRNRVQLLRSISDELRRMRDDLQRMKASMKTADLVEEDDHELKEWVRQLRDIVYDTEDVIAQFELHLQNDYPTRAFLLRSLCCTVQKLESHHQVTTDALKQIRGRITNIFEWQPKNWEKQIERPTSSSDGGDALLLDSTDLVGIDERKEQLIELLTEVNSNRKVISVVGMGGSGKTTLVKQVYEAVQVKRHFTVHAWITISQPLRMGELLREIVQQLFDAIRKPVPEGIDAGNHYWFKSKIKSFLQTYRYLIVLDNVWQVDVWHELNLALANNNFSSRIILTTQKSNVARSCCKEPEDQIFNLEPLPPKDSWDLFCRRSFGGSTCPPHLVGISERILERCEGLPLAIVAISGVLATKRQMINVAEWEKVHRTLGAEIKDNDELKSLREVLQLSFNDLPYHLKSCFLYLSIFPQSHLIEKMRLIRLWIAEGFIEVKEGKTREEAAEEYLNELLNRSLMQVATRTTDGRVKTCRIHDIWREMIMVISRSRDQNFVKVAKKSGATWQEKFRRLSIHSTWDDDSGNRNVSHIRSLFMFEVEEVKEVEDPLSGSALRHRFLNGFWLLRVLDLRGARLEVFPDEILNLLLLTYLSLRHTKIKTIPSLIGQLQKLETLDLKHTYVTELPIQILNLKQLSHLLVYRYEFKYYSRFHSKYGFKALAGIGALQLLQKLCFLEVDDETLIAELGKLTQLRRLGITNLRRSQGKILCSSIEKLVNLQALSVVSSRKDEVIDMQHLSLPPACLQRLYLSGRLEKIPEWVPSLHSLVKIYLKWSRLEHDPLESLEHLPNLLHLELLQVCQGDTLSFKARGFKKLKILGIDDFEQLKCIEVEKGAMPCLEKMSIYRCKLLEKLPSGIENLSMLKMLEFFDTSEELIKTLNPGEPGGDYYKVATIPEVYYTYYRDGELEVYSFEASGVRMLSARETLEYKTYVESIAPK